MIELNLWNELKVNTERNLNNKLNHKIMYICKQCGKEFSINPDQCDNCGIGVSPETFRIEIPTPYPSSVDVDEEMHLNMQLYMEYCLNNGYITPQEWLTNYKLF